MNYIVWEWESNPFLWIPYSPEVSNFLENALQNNENIVDIGRADINLSCYEVSLKKRTQTRLDTGTDRSIRRTPYPSSNRCALFGIVWEWLSDFGSWIPYDMETAQCLERERLNIPILDLENTPIRIPNEVDFKKNIQINKLTGFERPIQRRLHTTSYMTESGQNNFNASSRKSVSNPSSTTYSPVNTSLRNSPRVQTLSSKTSNLGSPSKTSQPARQQLSFSSVGATGGTSLGDDKDEMSKSKQRYYTSHGNERKKVKLNTQDDKDPLKSFCRDVTESTDQECSICFEKLKDVSGFHDSTSKPPDSDIKELKKCKHRFHGTCLLEFMKSGSKNGWIQCPTCKAIHGVKHGNQPKDGTMDVSRSSQSLPGHPQHGMIIITYNFRSGIQDKEHPHPGKSYRASGFPRVCYLPDNKKGQKVLKLLQKAWERRLIFTVATSNTTGRDDTVVWNEIHHKTEAFSNISGHGFPDPNYLDNVLAELAVQGIDDSDDKV